MKLEKLAFPCRLPDSEWLEVIERSATQRIDPLPSFPSTELQAMWVGRTNVDGMREVFPFYVLCKKHADLSGDILDFGVGWGRVSRVFLNEASPHQIYGVDTNQYILSENARLGKIGHLFHIDELGRLPFENDKFSLIFAYSVFTHLSKRNADHWIAEIKRVLKPGGIFVPTLLGRHILRMCVAGTEPNAPDYLIAMSKWFEHPETLLTRYDSGEFIFGQDRASDLYGWASVPRSYLPKWGFDELEFVENLGFDQGAAVLRKRKSPKRFDAR